jgi:hypothetical protein
MIEAVLVLDEDFPTNPAVEMLAALAFHSLFLVFLLNYIATLTFPVPQTNQFSFFEFNLPLLTAEMLVRLLTSGAEPTPAHQAFKTFTQLDFFQFKNLLTVGCRAEEVLGVAFYKLFQPLHT